MRTTIYIRKENQEWWKEFGSSAWVNEQIIGERINDNVEELTKDAPEFTVMPQEEKRSITDNPANPTKEEIRASIRRAEKRMNTPVSQVCKHGSAKGNCKHGCK